MDATAGLGRDAFVLASLAAPCAWSSARQWPPRCWPTALTRACPPDTADIAARMTVIHADASDWLASPGGHARGAPAGGVCGSDVPRHRQQGRRQKDMQAFQEVIGGDDDSPRLLAAALAARASGWWSNVRVWRRYGLPPTSRQVGKSTRFDVYSVKAMPLARANARMSWMTFYLRHTDCFCHAGMPMPAPTGYCNETRHFVWHGVCPYCDMAERSLARKGVTPDKIRAGP